MNELPLREVFKIFDEIFAHSKRAIVAYSGGKDSTSVSLLLYEWLREKGRTDFKIILLNSDTLSEIPAMRDWTKKFMDEYVSRLKMLGNKASYKIVTPQPVETFYWRLIVRGYPAPSFNFRWCVYLLKRKPALKIVDHHKSIVLMGHRDEESSARSKRLNNVNVGFCPLNAGRCSSYYLMNYGKSAKAFPIRDWSEKDVWSYLKDWRENGDIDLEPLFKLYGDGVMKARYGCWHCTLVKNQLGNYILDERYLYFEAVRLIYRWISDIPKMRVSKNTGYSKLGHLTPPARSFLLNALRAAEEISRIRLYGLDEAKLEGYTLREIFYELPEDEADKIITKHEKINKGDPKRYYHIGKIRDLHAYSDEIRYVSTIIERRSINYQLVKDYINEITSHLEVM